MASGSWAGMESETTHLVSQAVFFRLIKVLRRYGYPGFISGLWKPDGFRCRTRCTREAEELPVWRQLDFLEVEELPVFSRRSGGSKAGGIGVKGCGERGSVRKSR
jgi:hypothetical protein